jgi:RimJ/RimL family protein N-acetyltransferase
MEILTARLRQVPVRKQHAKAMFPILAEPELYEFTGGTPPASVEALAETYLAWESRRSPDGEQLWLNWMIRRIEGDEPVGTTQATVHPTHAFVAWVVGTEWQGRGYGSEAAAALVKWLGGLGITDIRACVHPGHEASQQVARNAGLRPTKEMIDGEEVWALPRS